MRMFHENYMEFIPILRNILLKKECLKKFGWSHEETY